MALCNAEDAIALGQTPGQITAQEKVPRVTHVVPGLPLARSGLLLTRHPLPNSRSTATMFPAPVQMSMDVSSLGQS